MRRLSICWVGLTACVVLSIGPAAARAADAARGAAVFALAAGCSCHTPAGGPVGAGGREMHTPFGIFYSTNITSDRETGIGAWSDEEIDAAIRRGWVRGKGVEAPVMPYYLYAGMADDDVRDLIAYLRTLPAVRRENRSARVRFPFPRLAYRAWRLSFTWNIVPPARAPAGAAVERGRYLANHVSLCVDCHTARDRFGVLERTMRFAGSVHGPDGHSVPNITPEARTGIGQWSIADLVEVMKSGTLPDLDNVQGLMAEVVDGVDGAPGYSRAAEDDLRAIAAYLKSLPAVENDVGDE